VTAEIVRDPVGTAFPDDAVVLTLSPYRVFFMHHASLPIEFVDDTVVLPADWESLPPSTAAADTFSFDLTVGAIFSSIPENITFVWNVSVDGNPPLDHHMIGTVLPMQISSPRDCPAVRVDQAAGQSDPTDQLPIGFTVEFSEPVIGFDAGDVVIGGTAGGSDPAVSGSGATYTVTVGAVAGPGTVTLGVPAGVVADPAGFDNYGSGLPVATGQWFGGNIDDTVTYEARALDEGDTIDELGVPIPPAGVTPSPLPDTSSVASVDDNRSGVITLVAMLAAVSVVAFLAPRSRSGRRR
jgi:hypothetical protein